MRWGDRDLEPYTVCCRSVFVSRGNFAPDLKEKRIYFQIERKKINKSSLYNYTIIFEKKFIDDIYFSTENSFGEILKITKPNQEMEISQVSTN